MATHEDRNTSPTPPGTIAEEASRRSPWPWIAVIVIVFAVIASSTFVFWRVETWPARTAGDVAQVFQETFEFEPRVTVQNRVVVEQFAPISELAVTESRVVAERDYENRWLLSTKRLRAQAIYMAKAGFDLERDVDVQLDRDAGTLLVRFPDAELLSLDREEVDILTWDNGLWNRLDGENAEQVMNELRTQAATRVAEQDLLAESRRAVEDRLIPALEERTGLEVSVAFRG